MRPQAERMRQVRMMAIMAMMMILAQDDFSLGVVMVMLTP